MDTEQRDKIAEELERLIAEEDPEVLEKLKNPEYSKEMRERHFDKTRDLGASLIILMVELALAGIHYRHMREAEKKIKKILIGAGTKEEKAKNTALKLMKLAEE